MIGDEINAGNAAWAQILGKPIPTAVGTEIYGERLAQREREETLRVGCVKMSRGEFWRLVLRRMISRKWRRAIRSPFALLSDKHVFHDKVEGVDSVACVKCGTVRGFVGGEPRPSPESSPARIAALYGSAEIKRFRGNDIAS